MGRLSATAVKAEKRPGRHGDGDSLFLMVSASGAMLGMPRPEKWSPPRHRFGERGEGVARAGAKAR